ncbi:MAG: hypothetical protein ACP5RJ_08180 [Conexivisphaera sp.]
MSATTSTMSSAGSSKSILINNLEARGLGFHAASVDGTEQFRPRDPRAGFPGPFVVAEGLRADAAPRRPSPTSEQPRRIPRAPASSRYKPRKHRWSMESMFETSESEEGSTPHEELERHEIDVRDMLEALTPFVGRVAVLSVPLMNARIPLFAAALPLPVEDDPWLGDCVRSLAAGGVPALNYVAHPPTLSALERILRYEFPAVDKNDAGEPVKFIRGKYAATHNDLQISLTLKQRVEEGRALAEEEIDGLIREGKISLTAIYYY